MPDPFHNGTRQGDENVSYEARGIPLLDPSLLKLIERRGFEVPSSISIGIEDSPSKPRTLLGVSTKELLDLRVEAAIELMGMNHAICSTRFRPEELETVPLWRRYLQQPDSGWDSISFIDEGRLVGGRNIFVYPTQSLGTIAFGEHLFVDERAEGMGHGRRIVLGTEPTLIQRGARMIFSESVDAELITPNEALLERGITTRRDQFWRSLDYLSIDGYYAQPALPGEIPLLHLKLGAKVLDPSLNISSLMGPVLFEAIKGFHRSFVRDIELDVVEQALANHYTAREVVGTVGMGEERNHPQNRAELERLCAERGLAQSGYDLRAELIGGGNIDKAMQVIEATYPSEADRRAARATFLNWANGNRTYHSPYQFKDLTLRNYCVFYEGEDPKGVAGLYEVTGQFGVAHIGWFGVANGGEADGHEKIATKLIRYCEEAARLQGAGEIKVFYPKAELGSGIARVHQMSGYTPEGQFSLGDEEEVVLRKLLRKAS